MIWLSLISLLAIWLLIISTVVDFTVIDFTDIDSPTYVFTGVETETEDEDVMEYEAAEFKSPEQINEELITLSLLPTSRWLNLLHLDVIKVGYWLVWGWDGREGCCRNNRGFWAADHPAASTNQNMTIFCVRNPNSGHHVFFHKLKHVSEAKDWWIQKKTVKKSYGDHQLMMSLVSCNQVNQITLIWMQESHSNCQVDG